MTAAFQKILNLPELSTTRPLRVLVSACLGGEKCGVDGSSNGDYPWIRKLLASPKVQAVPFCPEHFSFGTPRNLPDLHFGNGFDLLDGKARVLTDKGEDWSEGMLAGAREMLKLAQAQKVDLAILMDMSAACGLNVISDGCRLVPERKYQKDPGVCTALLLRAGIPVLSQRDFHSLEILYQKLDPTHTIDLKALNNDETEWYRQYFGSL